MTRRIGFVLFAAATLGCTADLTDREKEAIRRWVHCDECTGGEREAVRALGNRAVPRLKELLRDGPDDDWTANMEAKFTTVYVAAVGTAPGSAPIAPAVYVRRALDNYKANVQKRAAMSLRDIGTQESLNALSGAGTAVMRADVATMIGAPATAADSFPGSVEPLSIWIGDTIKVRPNPYEPFTGDERGSLDGAPFLRDTLHLSGNTAEFRFLAGRPGRRILTVRNVGNSADSQQTRVLVESSSDANDRLTTSCTDNACLTTRAPRYRAVTSPIKAVFSLWRTMPRPDTLDLITLRPTNPLHVTAAVNWTPSRANVDLRWVECATWEDRGNMDGATPTERPERTTVDISPHECWALLVVLRAQPQTARVTAYLQVTP